jgi:hypothetical protein
MDEETGEGCDERFDHQRIHRLVIRSYISALVLVGLLADKQEKGEGGRLATHCSCVARRSVFKL